MTGVARDEVEVAMIDSEALRQLFPAEDDVSREHRPPTQVHQRVYLVGGELKPWRGPVETVRSAICVRRADGSLEQIELGSYPQAGIAEAEEALAGVDPELAPEERVREALRAA